MEYKAPLEIVSMRKRARWAFGLLVFSFSLVATAQDTSKWEEELIALEKKEPGSLLSANSLIVWGPKLPPEAKYQIASRVAALLSSKGMGNSRVGFKDLIEIL